MLEKAFKGSQLYWTWVVGLLVVMAAGFGCYLLQLSEGLGITGMSRDVSWGFYIAQFTFLVGVAASAVMLVLPYYLHHNKPFGRIVILGEFLAIAAVTMCILFVTVDVGRPQRLLNLFLYPTPNSILFWDIVVLNGYLGLNLVIGWTTLGCERRGAPVPAWVKPLIYLSIPWAVSIHTVTAFLYAGLPGRGFWLTAILAPRFLASAFASGPAVLILLGLLVRRLTNFDPGREALQTLAKISTYAIILHVFFFLLEVFTAAYSKIPEHLHHLQYLYFGLHGKASLVPFMWAALVFAAGAIAMLVVPRWRANEKILAVACCLVFAATWIDKGLGMISGGFVPNPMGYVNEYAPTAPELIISLGVWATGFLILTVLYKIATSVKEDLAA